MRKLAIYLASAMLLVTSSVIAQSGFDRGAAAYKRGDFETALAVFRPLAENGDAKAQSILGLMYSYGEGVPVDYGEASRWYRRAAEQNSYVAQYNLGMLYLEGKGVSQDTDEAVKWLDKAAEGGHFRARTTLAELDGGSYSNMEPASSDSLEAPPTMATTEAEPRSVVMRKPVQSPPKRRAAPISTAPVAAAPVKTSAATTVTKSKLNNQAQVSKSAQASASSPQPPASNNNQYRVQLAASRSEENIRRDWSSYQNRYSDIFGGLNASVERAEVGEDKTVWYRLRVGPFANVASAKELCETLSARGIKTGCMPLRVKR
jgi:uncharacterized protein